MLRHTDSSIHLPLTHLSEYIVEPPKRIIGKDGKIILIPATGSGGSGGTTNGATTNGAAASAAGAPAQQNAAGAGLQTTTNCGVTTTTTNELLNADSSSPKTPQQKEAIALTVFNDCLLPYLQSNDETGAKTLMKVVHDHLWFRSEVYVQCIKQLTDCPDENEYERGWRLLRLLLKYYPPRGVEIECVVEQFLIKCNAKEYVSELHAAIFGESPLPVWDGSMMLMRQFKIPEIPASEKMAMQSRRLDKKVNRACINRLC